MGETDEIKAGMVGKFNGKYISQAHQEGGRQARKIRAWHAREARNARKEQWPETKLSTTNAGSQGSPRKNTYRSDPYYGMISTDFIEIGAQRPSRLPGAICYNIENNNTK